MNVGFPGSCTALIGAMTFSNPDTVKVLLDHGADPYITDITGNNPFMFACAYGRLNNVKLWMQQYRNWDLEARDKMTGAFALGNCVFMGPNRLALMQYLVKCGANLTSISHNGGTVLTAACASHDADPKVVEYLCQKISEREVNYQIEDRTIKWKCIRFFAKTLVRLRVTKSRLLKSIAQESRATPLHFAAKAGDIELVEMLLSHGADVNLKNSFGPLENGADPYIENTLGMNAFEICEKSGPFPSVMKALKEYGKKGRDD